MSPQACFWLRLPFKSVSFEESLLFSRMQVGVIQGEGLEGTKLTSPEQDMISSPAWRPLYLNCDISSAFCPQPEGLTTTPSVCVYIICTHTYSVCTHTHNTHGHTHMYIWWLAPIVNLISRVWPGRAASRHTCEGLMSAEVKQRETNAKNKSPNVQIVQI